MPTVFYSWQSDHPTLAGRNLIERALEKAIEELRSDTTLEAALREEDLQLDRDTRNVPGIPPITDTIFSKIDGAVAHVADLTFTGERVGGRPTPNPNVLIEYGWALKALTHKCIITVMNTAYGAPTAETLPFNMIHMRHPIKYNCPGDADEDTRRAARQGLVKDFKEALAAILKATSQAVASKPAQFEARPPSSGQERFRNAVEPLGVLYQNIDLSSQTSVFCWKARRPGCD